MAKKGRHGKHGDQVQKTSTGAGMATDLSADIVYEAHWEGLSGSEEESDIEIPEPEDKHFRGK